MNKKMVSLLASEQARAKLNILLDPLKRYYSYKEAYELENTSERVIELTNAIIALIDLKTEARKKSIGYIFAINREYGPPPITKEWTEMLAIAMAISADNTKVLIEYADNLIQSEDIDSALEYYDKASQAQSNDRDVLRLKLYFAWTIYCRATWLTSQEMSLNIYFKALGRIAQKTGSPLETPFPKELFLVDPRIGIYKSCIQVGKFYLKKWKYSKAIQFLQVACRLHPDIHTGT